MVRGTKTPAARLVRMQVCVQSTSSHHLQPLFLFSSAKLLINPSRDGGFLGVLPPAALMVLIDCLAVINGHMLKHAHAGHSYTDARRQFEGEGVSSSLEKHLSLAFGTGRQRGAPLWTAGPRVDLRRCVAAVRSEIFKEPPTPLTSLPPLLGRRQRPAGSRQSVLRQDKRLWVGVGVHCFIRIEAAACCPRTDDTQGFLQQQQQCRWKGGKSDEVAKGRCEVEKKKKSHGVCLTLAVVAQSCTVHIHPYMNCGSIVWSETFPTPF